MKSISREYAKRLSVPDPAYAASIGLPCPKFSDRVKRYQGLETGKQLAEREHLINLRQNFPKHLVSRYPNYKKELGSMLRTDANTKNKGGFAAPYTLD
jgi:hypothetical protein